MIPTARPRGDRPPISPSPEPKSSVSIWRAGQRRRWAVKVVEGTSLEELQRLVRLALDAADEVSR